MAVRKKKRPGCLSVIGLCLLAGGLASTFLVIAMRWVSPPCSAIRMERRLTAWVNDENYRAKHRWTSLENIAPCMGLAVIAAEDQNFPEHGGFDWEAIQKAMAHNERSRRKKGASTVSQQTAKNLFLWSSRSWVRKGFEAYFTQLIEITWSKRRILEVYLNIVEFGDGIYGVEAASFHFFHKPARKLRPSEAALLAAVLPNPHKFRANAPSTYIFQRQAWILRQMRSLGGEQLIKEL